MGTGLLADIILGESPHLRGLARFFNLLILDGTGKIIGLNSNMLKNAQKREDQIINQSFAKFFDSEEGKANLQITVSKAFKGQPCSIQFHLLESKVSFTGVILPIYDARQYPDSLIIITKEEHKILVEDHEIEDFWHLASKMMEEAGISSSNTIDTNKLKMDKPKILLIEDQNPLIIKVFKKLQNSKKEEVLIVPNIEAAQLLAEEFKPNVIITNYKPDGKIDAQKMASSMKARFNAETIFLSLVGNEIRIEDGWLDIHVKNQPDSVSKILELINQFYW